MKLFEACDALYGSDETAAVSAAHALATMVSVDVVDIRQAMPALAFALTRREGSVRLAAAHAVNALSDMHGHAELAFPALFALRDDPDLALRRIIYRTCVDITALDKGRLRRVIAVVRPVLEQASEDPDEDIRTSVRSALAALDR